MHQPRRRLVSRRSEGRTVLMCRSGAVSIFPGVSTWGSHARVLTEGICELGQSGRQILDAPLRISQLKARVVVAACDEGRLVG